MNDRNQKAREEFRMKMMQQMMMNPAMMQGMPPQKELTPEEKVEMEKQRKDNERIQRKSAIDNLQKTSRQKKAGINVLEKYLSRASASKDLLVNVDLDKAETEWHKKAVQAEIEELAAVIEENELSLEFEKESLSKTEQELQELLKEDKEAAVPGKEEKTAESN